MSMSYHASPRSGAGGVGGTPLAGGATSIAPRGGEPVSQHQWCSAQHCGASCLSRLIVISHRRPRETFNSLQSVFHEPTCAAQAPPRAAEHWQAALEGGRSWELSSAGSSASQKLERARARLAEWQVRCGAVPASCLCLPAAWRADRAGTRAGGATSTSAKWWAGRCLRRRSTGRTWTPLRPSAHCASAAKAHRMRARV